MGNKNSKIAEQVPQMISDNKPNKRINKEIEDLLRDNDISKNGYSVELVNNSKTHLIARISGPTETQYSGGIFCIDIVLQNSYQFLPPIFKFMTNIWHPNISSFNKQICSDYWRYRWTPALKLSNILLMTRSLLSMPEPNTPQDSTVANQYMNERQLFDKTAKYWTYIYAMDEESKQRIDIKEFENFDELVRNLMEAENLSRDQSLAALSRNGWNLTETLKFT
jgi:ubiquitin-conjugating enzyme (huntingtin interacting protein 2)